MVCIIDLCGEEDVIVTGAESQEPEAPASLPPPPVALQIVPVENDES